MLLWPKAQLHHEEGQGQHRRRDLIVNHGDVLNCLCTLATLFTKYVVKGGKVQRTAKMIRGEGP